MNILFLEDEPDLAGQLKHFLHKRGYSIEWTSSYAHTLRTLKTQAFDLLLLDRLVGDADIIDKIDTLRELHMGPIILLTALGSTEERVKGYRTGIDHYFAKPVDLDELHIVLSNLIHKSKQTHFSPTVQWSLTNKLLCCPNQKKIPLSSLESRILEVLMDTPNQAVDKKTLLSKLSIDYQEYDFRRLDSCLYRLRKKVSPIYSGHFPLETLYNLGYSWKVTDE
jgi:DNA-binding response OmpR family regulator